MSLFGNSFNYDDTRDSSSPTQEDWDNVDITASTKDLTTGITNTIVSSGTGIQKSVNGIATTAMGNIEGLGQKVKLDAIAKASNIGDFAQQTQKNLSNEISDIGKGVSSLKDGLFGGSTGSGKVIDPKAVTTAMPTGLTGVFNYGNIAGGDSSYNGAMVKLADPVFGVGKSSTGATVDIYGNVLQSPQNTISSVLSETLGIVNKGLSGIFSKNLSSLAGKITGLSKTISKEGAEDILNHFSSTILSGVPLTKTDMKNTLMKSLGFDENSAIYRNGLNSKSILSDMVSNIDGTSGLVALYNDTQMVLKGNYTTAQGIFKIIDNITGNTQLGNFLDITNQLKILGSVTKSLFGLGVTGAFDKLFNSITGNSNQLKYISDNLKSAANSGDINFFTFALQHVSGDWLIMHQPQLIPLLLKNYTPAKGTDGTVSKDTYAQFVNVINQINPEWYYGGAVGEVQATNLQVFSQMNSSAMQAFLLSGDARVIRSMIIAGKYSKSFVTLDELQKRYPNVPIK